MKIEALRTPDERFANITDFPFPPNYVDDLKGYEGLRAHYLDLGPKDAKHTFLCLHREPDWSYLYRKMIPVFQSSGARVVAPDFFGFGRSDKPVEQSVYTFNFHRKYLLKFVERLDLQNITLVVQDWGGVIGLTLPVDHSFKSRLNRLLVMNTVLAVGQEMPEGFREWREFVRKTPDLPIGYLFMQTEIGVTEEEAAAYDAPFPDASFKAGVRAFPDLLMDKPGMEGIEESEQAQNFWTNEWAGKSFMAIGRKDVALGMEPMLELKSIIKNCPQPMILEDAGHFVQEKGEPVAKAALLAWGD